jgi:hypothetical protein
LGKKAKASARLAQRSRKTSSGSLSEPVSVELKARCRFGLTGNNSMRTLFSLSSSAISLTIAGLNLS